MAMTMIEKMARAMAEHRHAVGDPPVETPWSTGRPCWIEVARVGLLAIREIEPHDMPSWNHGFQVYGWTDIIDAILAEES